MADLDPTLKEIRNSLLVCHSWAISQSLRKIANEFPKSTRKIQSYAKRLEAASKQILSISSDLRTHSSKTVNLNDNTKQPFLNNWHGCVRRFYALQYGLLYSSKKNGTRAYLKIKGKMLAALSAEAMAHYEEILSSFEEIATRTQRS